MKANELNIVKMLEIIGKTIENVQTMVSRKGDDIIIVIFLLMGHSLLIPPILTNLL